MFDFITLNARFVDYLPRITQIIKKLSNLYPMICKIYIIFFLILMILDALRHIFFFS